MCSALWCNKFPDKSELPKSINGRELYDNYITKIPVRKDDAKLAYKLALIPVSRDVNQNLIIEKTLQVNINYLNKYKNKQRFFNIVYYAN